MKITGFVAAAVAGALAFGTAALAHEMDADQDGLYSLAELRTEYPNLTKAEYAALDTNADEAVDAKELQAAWADGRLKPMD
jgi:hypothetical protein